MRKSPPHYSDVTAPLVNLIRRETAQQKSLAACWKAEHAQDFAATKHLLTTVPILRFHDLSKSFTIHVDATILGMDTILTEGPNDDLAIVAYFGKRFTNSQQCYSVTAKECYAVVLALNHWQQYRFGRLFTVITDHSAPRYLYTMRDSSNMLKRCSLILQSFDFTVVHRPGKQKVIPYMLSRLLAFEQQVSRHMPVALAPICRNTAGAPELHAS